MTLDWSLLCKPRLRELGLYYDGNIEDSKVSLGVIEWMDRQHGHKIDLLFALTRTRAFLATDPRDKVFALLDVLEDFSTMGFEADYSWSEKEVFTQVAAQLITSSNSVEILRHVGGSFSSSSTPRGFLHGLSRLAHH
jgi:hypothetical protein